MPAQDGEIVVEVTVKIRTNINSAEVMAMVNKAAGEGLLDTTVLIAGDVVRDSPIKFGTNKRSIDYWVRKLKAKIFSTSGYGGWLEVGTRKMEARPYFHPAALRHLPQLASNIAKRLRALGG